MFYYIIKLRKGLYIVSIVQSTSESSIITLIQKKSYLLMKLEPCIIFIIFIIEPCIICIINKLFLNFNDFEPQYSYKLYFHRKRVYDCLRFPTITNDCPMANVSQFVTIVP